MSENDGDGGHKHRFESKVPHEGHLWCKLCKRWLILRDQDKNCPGMTKEDRKRIREREKAMRDMSVIGDTYAEIPKETCG